MCRVSSQYQAYLLRLKRTQSRGPWRVTLHNVQTGEIVRFATEQELFQFLAQTLAVPVGSPDVHERSEAIDDTDPQ